MWKYYQFINLKKIQTKEGKKKKKEKKSRIFTDNLKKCTYSSLNFLYQFAKLYTFFIQQKNLNHDNT